MGSGEESGERGWVVRGRRMGWGRGLRGEKGEGIIERGEDLKGVGWMWRGFLERSNIFVHVCPCAPRTFWYFWIRFAQGVSCARNRESYKVLLCMYVRIGCDGSEVRIVEELWRKM